MADSSLNIYPIYNNSHKIISVKFSPLMTLQIPPFATPMKHLSKADSLNISMQSMQLKIDSLEKVVLRTEIGTSFFWSVIGLQLAIFIVLVGFGSWISWHWFQKQILNTKRECKKHSEELIILKNMILI